jgi:hypothetical protein
LVSSIRSNEWPFVAVLSTKLVEHHAENDGCSEENTAPIHIDKRWTVIRGKETKEHGDHRISQANHVHNGSEDGSHMPRTPAEIVFDGIIAKSFVEEKCNGNYVGGEERGDIDGHDCVERGRTSNVDESEEE